MTRHIHADLMIQAANDTTIRWQVNLNGEWENVNNAQVSWSFAHQYRQRPAAHPHQALMDIAKADPSIEWEYQFLANGRWYACVINEQELWVPEYQYRQKPAEPKMVDLWQWAVSDRGLIYSTQHFYHDEAELVGVCNPHQIICRIEGSKITVPEVSQ